MRVGSDSLSRRLPSITSIYEVPIGRESSSSYSRSRIDGLGVLCSASQRHTVLGSTPSRQASSSRGTPWTCRHARIRSGRVSPISKGTHPETRSRPASAGARGWCGPAPSSGPCWGSLRSLLLLPVAEGPGPYGPSAGARPPSRARPGSPLASVWRRSAWHV